MARADSFKFTGLPDPDGKQPPSRSAKQSRASSSGAASHQADGDDDAYHFAKSLFDMKVDMLICYSTAIILFTDCNVKVHQLWLSQSCWTGHTFLTYCVWRQP